MEAPICKKLTAQQSRLVLGNNVDFGVLRDLYGTN